MNKEHEKPINHQDTVLNNVELNRRRFLGWSGAWAASTVGAFASLRVGDCHLNRQHQRESISCVKSDVILFKGFFCASSFLGLKALEAKCVLSDAKLESAGLIYVDYSNDCSRSIALHKPGWLHRAVPKQEVEQFENTVSILPPTGGKIPLSSRGVTYKLAPSLTAEEQIHNIINRRRRYEFGSGYVDQYSVQGRLPDRFKFAAIALVVNNPHGNNWEKIWIDNPWGRVAPLIHDGGNSKKHLNRRWGGVVGRTDFLQNYEVVEPQQDLADKRETEERPSLPSELQHAALLNGYEEQRLRNERRFYQRMAFALHAEAGTAPASIPEDIRKKAAATWNSFELEIRSLLADYGTSGVGEVTWFLEQPRELPGWRFYGLRHEADYPPIQRELIKLEEKKQQHRDFQADTALLIHESAEKIDQLIGLNDQLTSRPKEGRL